MLLACIKANRNFTSIYSSNDFESDVQRLLTVRLQFRFDFASTYSYPAAMRIESVAKAQDVEIEWNAFLLGPIFRAQGWHDSPFNVYPVKGRYM